MVVEGAPEAKTETGGANKDKRKVIREVRGEAEHQKKERKQSSQGRARQKGERPKMAAYLAKQSCEQSPATQLPAGADDLRSQQQTGSKQRKRLGPGDPRAVTRPW